MKAKITARKMRFLMLCLTVLFSVMGISFSASAADCTHPNLKESNWEVVQKTTCKEQGYKTQWCQDCGTEVKEYLPFDENAHVKDVWTIITPHTCQSDGYQVKYCYYGCQDKTTGEKIILEEKTIPAHDYQIIYREDATCQKAGYKFVACVTCYDSYSETISIDKDAHSYTPWYVVEEATCIKAGVEKRKCLDCGFVDSREYTDADNHGETVWDEENKVPATCDAPGYIPGVCPDCKKEMKQEIPQHTNSAYTSISVIASTCHKQGVERRLCKCGFEYDFALPIDDEAHVYSEWQITKEPSCTEGSRYKYCKYHYDATIVEAIPASGEHNYGEWEVVIEPDCSMTGLEERTCTDCAEGTAGHTETRTLPTKHDYCDWTTVVEMSCDEKDIRNGTKLAKCDNCSYEKYFTIPAVHSFDEWGVIEEADCKTGKPGIMQRRCTACKKVENKQYYEEHDFTAWYVTGEPVCAQGDKTGRTGTYTRWCNNCRTTEHKAIGVNHEFVDLCIDKYPVCVSNGAIIPGSKTVKCKFCDVTDTVEIDGKHNFGEWVVTTESTCEAVGEKVRTCVCCGYNEKASIPSHEYGSWLYNGEKVVCGTEFDQAVTLERKCTKCNVWDSTKKIVRKIEHPNKITVVTEATCTTSGYTVEICPDCGYETTVGDIIPAKGHTLDEEWSSRNEPTCYSEGSRYKACADCDYIDYYKVDRTDHSLMELTPGLAPTCTQSGYSAETFCSVCKQVFPSETIDALGHTISDDTGLCTVCKVYDGYECACDCHSTSGIQKIFFSIINKLYQMFGINQKCSCGVLHYDEPGFFAKLFGTAGE